MKLFFYFFLICFSYKCTTPKKVDNDAYTNILLEGYLKPNSSIPYSTWIKLNPSIENLKLKGAVINGKGYQFKIGLCDMNNNGIFCDKGKDIISVDVFDASGMYISNSISCEKVNDAIIIECNDIYFYVTSIDSFGNNIRIKKLNKKPKTEYLIKVVNIIPNVEFENLSGEKVNLQSFLNIKKYVYIEFWATWCPPCVEGVDYLNEAINTRNDLIIIALNANEEKNEIKNSLSKYDIKCIQGLSNPLVEKNLHQNGYPYGVLFNKEGYPVRFGVDPKNLLNEITEYEKK